MNPWFVSDPNPGTSPNTKNHHINNADDMNCSTTTARGSIAMSTTTSIALDHNDPIRSFDSSTSINSLFDSVPCSITNTITPILSRNDDFSVDFQLSYADHQLGASYNSDAPEKTVVMLVGLPATGKSTMAKQLDAFINQNSSFVSRIYNAGDVRRRNATFDNSDFFDPNNLQGKKDRELYANINIHNLISDMDTAKVQVGFLDATNTTVDRRARMFDIIRRSGLRANIVIMDVQCNKEYLLQFNISGKAHNLDYKDKDYLASIQDFKKRTEHYYKVYQPITKQELVNYSLSTYVRVLNGGETFENLYVDKKFQATSQFHAVLSQFESKYYKMEGKRYFEAVEAFYKNSMTNIAKLDLS